MVISVDSMSEESADLLSEYLPKCEKLIVVNVVNSINGTIMERIFKKYRNKIPENLKNIFESLKELE